MLHPSEAQMKSQWAERQAHTDSLPASTINNKVEQIQNILEAAHSMVESLSSRLYTIMPDISETGTSTLGSGVRPVSPSSSPLHGRLTSIEESLRYLCTRINSLENRIDL